MKEALEAFTSLCRKMEKLLDANDAKIAHLQAEIDEIKRLKSTVYSQSQASAITGWSKSTIAVWIQSGFLTAVPVIGKKCPCLPASEVDKILRVKGPGKHYKKSA